MKERDNNRVHGRLTVVIVALGMNVIVFLAPLVFAGTDSGGRSVDYRVVVGFFDRFDGRSIVLVDKRYYSRSSYQLSPEVILIDRRNQPISRAHLVVHSEIRMVITKRLVRKIILMEQSS